MDIAKVTTKGQVTIPVDIRRALNIEEGDKLLFLNENGRVYICNAGGHTGEGVEQPPKVKRAASNVQPMPEIQAAAQLNTVAVPLDAEAERVMTQEEIRNIYENLMK